MVQLRLAEHSSSTNRVAIGRRRRRRRQLVAFDYDVGGKRMMSDMFMEME